MNRKQLNRARWTGAIIGLIVGVGVFVVAPMYSNYQNNGCVFIVCE